MAQRVDVFKGGRWPSASYSEIVSTFGEIVAEASDDDYQGDSLYLIRAGDQVGILTFGWGSCSGCDALESALYPEETAQQQVNELQDDLERGIRWFGSLEDAKGWLADPAAFESSYLSDELLGNFRAEVART